METFLTGALPHLLTLGGALIGNYVYMRVKVATLETRMNTVERDIKDHNDIFLRLTETLNRLDKTLARNEERLEFVIERLKEKG